MIVSEHERIIIGDIHTEWLKQNNVVCGKTYILCSGKYLCNVYSKSHSKMPRHTKRPSLDDIPNASFWTVGHTNANVSRFNTGADKTVDVQVM